MAAEPVPEEEQEGQAPEDAVGLDEGQSDRESSLEVGPDEPVSEFEEELPALPDGGLEDGSGSDEEEGSPAPQEAEPPIEEDAVSPPVPEPPASLPGSPPADGQQDAVPAPDPSQADDRSAADDDRPEREKQGGSHVAQPPGAGHGSGTTAANGAVRGTDVRVLPTGASAPAAVSAEKKGSAGSSPSRSRKVHVVEPGETLWSIARESLGEDASNADVATEVHRLWRLNADRIGTGTPDLIRPGQKLILA
jgi:nucleoid-associated protein YgaU